MLVFLDFPPFPACKNDKWIKAPGSLSAFNSALNGILVRAGSLQKVTSHALKTTLLSWSCSYGLSKESRKTLGYHKSYGDGSVRAYCRDHLNFPVSQLEKMLGDIRDKKFHPTTGFAVPMDSSLPSPSELWGPPPEISPTAPFVGEAEANKEDDNDSDSGSDQSLDPKSDDETDEDRERWDCRASLALRKMEVLAGERLFQNVDTGKIHRGLATSVDRSHCNIVMDPAKYMLMASVGELSATDDRCGNCFRAIRLVDYLDSQSAPP